MLGFFSIQKGKSSLSKRDLMQRLESEFESQGGVCVCCGIEMKSAVGIIYLDGDAGNAKKGNIKAACKPCEALHNGGRLTAKEEAGFFIFLPRVSQVDVIRLAYAIDGIRRYENPSLIEKLSEVQNQEIPRLKALAIEKTGINSCDDYSNFILRLNSKMAPYANTGMGDLKWFPDLKGKELRDHVNAYKGHYLSESNIKTVRG